MKICAVDTNILVRLASGQPAALFHSTVSALESMLDRFPGIRIVAHNMAIGEAYIALQKHYGLTKPEARTALADTLNSGLLEPLDGRSALDAITAAAKGAGLIDRMLLLDAHARQTAPLYTLDHALAKVPGAELLVATPSKEAGS